MALVTVVLTEKDRKAYAKSVLINTKKVCDFYKDGTSTVFHYEFVAGEKTPALECKTSYGKGTFHALVRQNTNERWFNAQVLTEQKADKSGNGVGRAKAVNVVKKLDSDRVIWAENVGTGSNVWYARSPFEVVVLRTSHTISDLNRAESNSASLSAS